MAWRFVHNLLAHPLLALTLESSLAVRFHDWTANKAWPRLARAELDQGGRGHQGP